MNTRSHVLELTVTPVQVEEVIKALFHTILLHRTTGKYSYANPSSGTFSVGTVGVEDVDCSSFDFTYVRCASEELDEWLSEKVRGFTSSLCQQGGTNSGKISLEFYERKKARWLLPPEVVNWEVWHLHLLIVEPSSDQGWHNHTLQLASSLPESILYICEVMNRPDYVPQNPTSENLPNIYETRFPTIQPYLHNVTYELTGESMAGAVRKLFRNTFAY